MNEIMWKLSVGKKSLGPHWFHCWLTVSLYIAEGGFNIIKSTLCLLAIKWTDTQIWTHRHSHKCRLTCTHLNARIPCRSCKKKSCKSLSRNVLLFNKSMASPVENVSLLPRRGVKCEQAAGPTGGPALTPVVWILCGRVRALPTLQVPVEKTTPMRYCGTCPFVCPHGSPVSCVGVRRDAQIVSPLCPPETLSCPWHQPSGFSDLLSVSQMLF